MAEDEAAQALGACLQHHHRQLETHNALDNPVVKAKKEFAQQVAVASGITYRVIGGKDVTTERYKTLVM